MMMTRPVRPTGSTPGAVPAMPGLTVIPSFALRPVASLLATQKTRAARRGTEDPVSMDALGQSYGFVMYEHTATRDASGNLTIGDGARDRAIIYVNGTRVGVIDAIYKEPAKVQVALKRGDTLQMLVENLGRVDVGQRLRDQVKGIVGRVSVGAHVLAGRSSYSMPLDKPPVGLSGQVRAYELSKDDSPVLYAGFFDLPEGVAADVGGDTFMVVPEGIKGVVWVNGINMGRYWTVEPQQSLYVPGCYLREKRNEVMVLELEPRPGVELSAQGIAQREWFNRADPDAP